jgi:hypothetical protein
MTHSDIYKISFLNMTYKKIWTESTAAYFEVLTSGPSAGRLIMKLISKTRLHNHLPPRYSAGRTTVTAY